MGMRLLYKIMKVSRLYPKLTDSASVGQHGHQRVTREESAWTYLTTFSKSYLDFKKEEHTNEHQTLLYRSDIVVHLVGQGRRRR